MEDTTTRAHTVRRLIRDARWLNQYDLVLRPEARDRLIHILATSNSVDITDWAEENLRRLF